MWQRDMTYTVGDDDAIDRGHIDACIADMEEPAEEIATHMQALLEEAEPRSGVLHLMFV